MNMHYIVGLGNPGKKYENTRHNAGWLVLDAFIKERHLPEAYTSSKYAGRLSEGVLADTDVAVLYPDTYMNKSGSAVQKLVPKDALSKLVVIYDDVDLPIGEFKLSVGRGGGGHNGIKSIVASMGSKEFVRVRVGVAGKGFWTGATKRPAAGRMSSHVLGRFGRREMVALEAVIPEIVSAIEMVVTDGVEKAMNRFNRS